MPAKTDPLERPKRFYKTAAAGPVEGGFAVLLDGRAPKSPGGARLVLPTLGLAELIAAEWERQGEYIALAEMAANRLANTTLDHVPKARAAVAQEVADYAGSDALCYLAEHPRALVEREQAAWRPWLDWAAKALGVHLQATHGIVHVTQRAADLVRVRDLAAELDDFSLAGLAFGAPLFGSSILAFAVQRGALSGEAAFDLSRLDQTFQEEMWGVDGEAAARTARLRADAAMLGAWFSALSSAG